MFFLPKTYGMDIAKKLNENQSLYINKILKDGIKSFEKTHKYDQSGRNNVGRIVHFWAGILGVGDMALYAIANDYKNAFHITMVTNINLGLDKMFHNIAMRKAQVLVRHLKSQGISDEDTLTQAVDLYMKKRGGILYSTFVRKFQKNKIKQVARGEKASQIKGVMTYLQRKYTFGSESKAQMVKAKRNFKKLGKAMIAFMINTFN